MLSSFNCKLQPYPAKHLPNATAISHVNHKSYYWKGPHPVTHPSRSQAKEHGWARVIITCEQTRQSNQCHCLLSLTWGQSRICLPDNVHMEPIWRPSELSTFISWYHNLEEDWNFRNGHCSAEASFIENRFWKNCFPYGSFFKSSCLNQRGKWLVKLIYLQ